MCGIANKFTVWRSNKNKENPKTIFKIQNFARNNFLENNLAKQHLKKLLRRTI